MAQCFDPTSGLDLFLCGSDERHGSMVLGCDNKQIYPYRRRRPRGWSRKWLHFWGRTEYGVWRLACITHASCLYCLYSIVGRKRGRRGGGRGIEAETRRYWMIVPRLVQCSQVENNRSRPTYLRSSLTFSVSVIPQCRVPKAAGPLLVTCFVTYYADNQESCVFFPLSFPSSRPTGPLMLARRR